MKKRYYILIAILSYLFFTLGNIPAAKVMSLVKNNSQIPASLYGVHGSLWQGGADKLLIIDTPEINNLQWSINPAYLLIAKLQAELRASIKNQNIIGDVSIGPAGTLVATDLRSRIDAAVMQELLKLPLGELDGTFIFNILRLEAEQNTLPLIDGTIKWQGAQLTLAETVDLGHINITLKPADDNKLLVTISNQKGQISLSGKATVDASKAYTIDLDFTPESTASENIRQSLKMFARRQSDGSYQLKRNGNLKEFGI